MKDDDAGNSRQPSPQVVSVLKLKRTLRRFSFEKKQVEHNVRTAILTAHEYRLQYAITDAIDYRDIPYDCIREYGILEPIAGEDYTSLHFGRSSGSIMVIDRKGRFYFAQEYQFDAETP